ncbi:MAG TPA: flagellar M-ring protein FliF C-terminal domain-containing protein, partial [Rariglobus sp.]
FDPDGQVVRSQTQTEDVSNSTEQRAGGSTGVAANTPDKPGATDTAARPNSVTESNRKNRTISYEINRTLTNTSRQPGTVRNVTASVFVAQRYAPVPAGSPAGTAPVPQPRTPEELQSLRKIVINALGLKAPAGQSLDSLVSLQELPFMTEPVSAQIQQIQSETRIQGWIETAGAYVPVGIGALVLFFFVRMLRRQRPEPVPVELLSAPSGGGSHNGQNGHTHLTADLLNELIQQKPANIGTALRDYMTVKKN